jgi:hypothetical protein
MDYVYFPTTSIVSNFYELESGASAEISVTGNDGLVGIALIMGGETTTSRAVVRNAGHGYRLEAELLKREFENGPMLRSVLLRYTQALITQMAQIAVCNCTTTSSSNSVDCCCSAWIGCPERNGAHPGIDRQPARRAPRKRHRSSRKAASSGAYSLQPRAHQRTRSSPDGKTGMRVLCRRQIGIRPFAAARRCRSFTPVAVAATSPAASTSDPNWSLCGARMAIADGSPDSADSGAMKPANQLAQ